MQPGEFNRRIAIMRPVETLDDCGKPVRGEPVILFESWARFKPVSDGEKLTHSLASNLTARFTIRWTPLSATAETSDLLVFEGRDFGIFAIKEIGFREFLEITANGR